jgi:hypothetical protein
MGVLMSCYISDLSGASLSLSDPSLTAGTYVSATINGSDAVLSVPASPSIDGKQFKLSVVLKVTDDGSVTGETDFGGTLAIGSSLPGTQIESMNGTGIGSGTYSFEMDCIWDSTSQVLAGYCVGGISSKNGSGASNGNINGPNSGSGGFRVTGISSQTSIKFMYGAFWNNTSNPASITLVEFKISLI